MNKALFRGFWELLFQDYTDKAKKGYQEALLPLIGLTTVSTDLEKRGRVLPFYPAEFINLPRIVFEGVVYAKPNSQVYFLRDYHIRIVCQTKDQTYNTNFSIMENIRLLIDEETPLLGHNDKVEQWFAFQYEGEGTFPLMVADCYTYYNEYSISVSPSNNKILLNN